MATLRGESGYMLATSALARGEFNATLVAETPHQRINSFPWPPLLLHAAGMRMAGPAGLLLADFLVAALTFSLLKLLAHALGWRGIWSQVGALLLLYGVVGWGFLHLGNGFGILYAAGGPFSKYVYLLLLGIAGILLCRQRSVHPAWSALSFVLLAFLFHVQRLDEGLGNSSADRFPRVYVTNLFFYFWLLSLLYAHRHWIVRDSTRRFFWLISGLGAGLTLQGDLYGFIALGMVHGVLALNRFRQRDFTPLWSLVSLSIAILPMLFQRLAEHPDIPLRFGLHPLPVSDGLTSLNLIRFAVMLSIALSVGLLARLARPRWILPLLIAAGIDLGFQLTPSLFALLHLKFPQIWHYIYLQPNAHLLLASFAFLWWAAYAANRDFPLNRTSLHFIPLTSALLLLLALPFWRWQTLHDSLQARLSADTRDLWAELDRRPLRHEILGTLSPSAMVYWGTWKGPLLIPETFASSLPDDEVDERFLATAQELGFTSAQIQAALQDRTILVTYLGHYKHQYSPLAWSLPADLETDYMTRYAALSSATSYRCDLLVGTEGQNPSPDRWRCVYRNATYCLYERIEKSVD